LVEVRSEVELVFFTVSWLTRLISSLILTVFLLDRDVLHVEELFISIGTVGHFLGRLSAVEVQPESLLLKSVGITSPL
jgi:hypothetical protein